MSGDESVRIGVLCADDHPIFGPAADRLRADGFAVRFFNPQEALSAKQVDDLSLLVNKQVFPVTFPALWYAHRRRIPLWNPLTATMLFSSRLIALTALERVGFRTPDVTFEKPEGHYLAKSAYVWEGTPELNGDGDFYQCLVPTEPVDYKYYAVDDGAQIHTVVRRVTSKLYGPKRPLGPGRVNPELEAGIKRLMARTGLRGVGVDLVKESGTGRFWAVDVNLAAGYRNTGLEAPIYESIRSSLRSP